MDMLRRMFGLGPARRDNPPDQTMFTNESGNVRVQMKFDQSGMGAMVRHNFGQILGWDNVPDNIGMVPVIEVQQDGKWQPVSGSNGAQPNLQTQMNFLQGWTETGIIGPQPINPEGSMATSTELYEQPQVAQTPAQPAPPLALPPAYAPYSPLLPGQNAIGPYTMGVPAIQMPGVIGPPNLGAIIQGPPNPGGPMGMVGAQPPAGLTAPTVPGAEGKTASQNAPAMPAITGTLDEAPQASATAPSYLEIMRNIAQQRQLQEWQQFIDANTLILPTGPGTTSKSP